MGSPPGFEALFNKTYIDYANADIVGSFDDPPPELVHRIHLVATPEPGIVTVCGSIDDTSAEVLRLAVHLDLV